MGETAGRHGRRKGAGTVGRMWVGHRDTDRRIPGRPSPATSVDECEVKIAVRDRTILARRLFRPVLPFPSSLPPAVVVRNGYSGMDWTLLPYLRDLAARGYAVVVIRSRELPVGRRRWSLRAVRRGRPQRRRVDRAAGLDSG